MFAALNTFLSGGQIPAAAGQQEYTSAGTYSWTAPAGVTSVSVVCIGGGGSNASSGGGNYLAGGGGGALAYKNNISVTPGVSYAVVVGDRGYSSNGEDSSFTTVCIAQGGRVGQSIGSTSLGGAGGTVLAGDGGGSGGAGGDAGNGVSYSNPLSGGGGAGGYSGNGGRGADGTTVGVAAPMTNNTSGSGGGGAGGFGGSIVLGQPGYPGGTAGGGVSIYGQGTSGVTTRGSQGGSGGGSAGVVAEFGGGDAGTLDFSNTNGYHGAVRIIWPGTTGITRAFPSTNTTNM
jgi:hypothetical protein